MIIRYEYKTAGHVKLLRRIPDRGAEEGQERVDPCLRVAHHCPRVFLRINLQ